MMTDNEIIKALVHCLNTDSATECAECSYGGKENCLNRMMTDVLDLINRQKAEIERLQTAKSFECNVTKFFDRYKTHIKTEAVKEVIETMKPWYRFLCVDKGDWYE